MNKTHVIRRSFLARQMRAESEQLNRKIMKSKKTHRQIIEQMQISAKKHRELSHQLGIIEYKKFGFSFSDTNDDILIDSLDYGICAISFEGYLKKMNEYKSKNKA